MLGEFAWIYEAMGALGWPRTEVDEMEVAEVARFLGVGSRDPIAAGARGIRLPSDDDGGRSGAGGFHDSKLKAREAEMAARREQNRSNGPP